MKFFVGLERQAVRWDRNDCEWLETGMAAGGWWREGEEKWR